MIFQGAVFKALGTTTPKQLLLYESGVSTPPDTLPKNGRVIVRKKENRLKNGFRSNRF